MLPFASPALLNIATPVLVIALGAALIDRFVRSLADVEKTNTELETRIHEREQLLKRNFDRLRESERVKASAQERQRIMQDMHDGLGSQLLSSLMLVERGAMTNEQVAQILRESIDDMRLAIDALAAEDSDLLAALGNMRFRMEPRLKVAGMELQWDARNLPEEVDIDPNARAAGAAHRAGGADQRDQAQPCAGRARHARCRPRRRCPVAVDPHHRQRPRAGRHRQCHRAAAC